MYTSLNSKDFLNMLGEKSNKIQQKNKFGKNKFLYRFASNDESNEIINKILNSLYFKNISVSGKHRYDRWEDGWSENLKNFRNSNYNSRYLKPGYYRKSHIQRLYRKFIITKSGSFEYDFYCILRDWLFKFYLHPYDEIFEFGCGPAHNVYILSTMYPKKLIHGLDWAISSSKIIKLIANKNKRNVQGHVFNMFDPDYSINIPHNSAFISIGGLEQIGKKFKKFLKYVFVKKPKIIIHLEPLQELYDQNSLLDTLGLMYHKKRNYLDGYLTSLKELEKKSKIKILKCQKINFGGINHEGWSILIWKII